MAADKGDTTAFYDGLKPYTSPILANDGDNLLSDKKVTERSF